METPHTVTGEPATEDDLPTCNGDRHTREAATAFDILDADIARDA